MCIFTCWNCNQAWTFRCRTGYSFIWWRYSDEDLLKLANVIGAAFFIDKTKNKGQELLERLGMVAKRMQGISDEDIDVLWVWLKNIAARGLSKDKEKEIEDIFQKERKVLNMVYAIERVMQHERSEAMSEGKAEGKIEIAKEMIKMGMSDAEVQQATKLPPDTIQGLRETVQ